MGYTEADVIPGERERLLPDTGPFIEKRHRCRRTVCPDLVNIRAHEIAIKVRCPCIVSPGEQLVDNTAFPPADNGLFPGCRIKDREDDIIAVIRTVLVTGDVVPEDAYHEVPEGDGGSLE